MTTAPLPVDGDERARGMGLHMVRGLFLDVGLPIVTYYGLRALGVAEWPALLAATAVAGARLLWGLVRHRQVNQFAVIMLLVYGVGLVLSLITGDPRLLLMKDSLVTGAVGAVFLGTAIVGERPLTLSAMQSFQPARAAELGEEFRTEPIARRAYLLSAYVWGVGLIAEAILRIPIVYLLPIDAGFGLSEALLVVTFVLLIGWNVWYVRRLSGTVQETS